MTNLTVKQIAMLDKLSRFLVPSIAIGTILNNIITAANDNNVVPIATGTPVNAVNALGTLTVDTIPTAGDSMTIDAKVFTFVATGTAAEDGEINIGATLGATQTSIIAAIKGTDHNDAHPTVDCGAFADDALEISALVAGVAGNSIVTTSDFTALTNVFSGPALRTGVNSTVAIDGMMLKDDGNLYISVGASTISTKNWQKVGISDV
jgi:hypothetical protein